MAPITLGQPWAAAGYGSSKAPGDELSALAASSSCRACEAWRKPAISRGPSKGGYKDYTRVTYGLYRGYIGRA